MTKKALKLASANLQRFALPWWAQWILIVILGAVGVLDLSGPLPGFPDAP